ncbi:MAG: ABC-F family ATP-binding cassette domain-containing protein, partial [Myxococcota bacterium]
MISLSNLGKSFGDRTLFSGVTLRLDAGSRYGLVGANGSGKTTLMRMLVGEDSPSDGEIIIPQATRIGWLKQDRYLSDTQRIIDVAMMGEPETWAALSEKDELLEQEEPDPYRIADLEEVIARRDGYTLEPRAATILEGLGIPTAVHTNPLGSLSGGFKLRVLLAQTLVEKPDLLLLDEPTNHLDILTIQWLETFLNKYPGCAVVISHDHRFLDNCATHILDVDYETVTQYKGNYAFFTREKALVRERKEAEIDKQQQIIADKKAFVEKFRAKATKARQAQSRAKQIEKIEAQIEDLPTTSRRAPLFRFEQVRNSGKDVLTARGVKKAFGDKRVLEGVDLSIRRGERVALIGANGLGKSTLLKIVTERLPPDDGEIEWGHETNVGYFAQDHADLLGDKPTTVLDYLWDFCPQESTSFVRGKLGQMLFSRDEVAKKTTALSGGEAARLIFSRLMVQRPNVMLLDEPTNHLDLETIEALVDALIDYPGTLMFVSHDRWFVQALATRVIELTPEGVEDYPGTYDDYLAHKGMDHLDAAAVLAKAKRDKRARKGEGAAEGTAPTRMSGGDADDARAARKREKKGATEAASRKPKGVKSRRSTGGSNGAAAKAAPFDPPVDRRDLTPLGFLEAPSVAPFFSRFRAARASSASPPLIRVG